MNNPQTPFDRVLLRLHRNVRTLIHDAQSAHHLSNDEVIRRLGSVMPAGSKPIDLEGPMTLGTLAAIELVFGIHIQVTSIAVTVYHRLLCTSDTASDEWIAMQKLLNAYPEVAIRRVSTGNVAVKPSQLPLLITTSGERLQGMGAISAFVIKESLRLQSLA